jgi:anti-anti-sigma factor
MDIQEEQRGDDGAVLSLKGRLDAFAAPTAEAELTGLIEKGRCHLVFDLTELAYISSAGMRALLVVARAAKAKDGSVSLCGVGATVKKVLDVTGVSPLFPLHDTRAEALAALESG